MSLFNRGDITYFVVGNQTIVQWSNSQQQGYISADKPLIGKIMALCLLHLSKKGNCFYIWGYMFNSYAKGILSTQLVLPFCTMVRFPVTKWPLISLSYYFQHHYTSNLMVTISLSITSVIHSMYYPQSIFHPPPSIFLIVIHRSTRCPSSVLITLIMVLSTLIVLSAIIVPL